MDDRRDQPPAAATTTTSRPVVTRSPAMVVVRRFGWLGGAYEDRVDWGAIWGGLLTAVGVFVLLSTLATAVGITTVQETDVAPADVNRVSGVVSAIIGLLAFFLGGLVAGRGAGASDSESGALNGFLVWALAVVLVLVLAGLGLGQLFGALAGNFEQYRQIGNVDVDQAALIEGIQTGAWLTFIALALAATAATLGGWLGGASDID